MIGVLAGGSLLLPACVVGALAIATGSWGFVLVYALGFTCLGLAAVVTGRWRWRWLIAGMTTLVAAGSVRASQLNDDAPLQVITLPGPAPSRWVDALLPEREGTLLAARLLGLRDGGDELEPLLHAAYVRMDRELGAVPTPAIATYLGLQSAQRFDAVVIEPPGSEPARSALIFLHGYAGNFAVYCWQVARAARATRTLVVCPSLGPRGDFWTRRGLLTARTALEYVRGRGIQRVVLAGLSNGAVGAGVIARSLAPALDGVILISGAPAGKPAALPLLVIHGTRDGMASPRRARSHAASAGTRANYVALDGGHFVFLSHAERVTAAIGNWLAHRFEHVGRR